MKSCDTCENYFCRPEPGSPCEQCLTQKGHKGFKRAGLLAQVRIWLHQMRLVLRGSR